MKTQFDDLLLKKNEYIKIVEIKWDAGKRKKKLGR